MIVRFRLECVLFSSALRDALVDGHTRVEAAGRYNEVAKLWETVEATTLWCGSCASSLIETRAVVENGRIRQLDGSEWGSLKVEGTLEALEN